jgi:PKD repeat protein
MGDGSKYWDDIGVELMSSANPPPVANCTAAPLTGAYPLEVAFDGSASQDSGDGFIVLYEWDFDGDGTYDWSGDGATNGIATFTYTSSGTYSAMLRVTDNERATGTESVTVTVTEPDQPASIVSQPADQGVNEGASATFTVAAAGTEPISYQWQRLNGTWEDIGGATGSSYTISEALYPDDDGATLRCFVSNAVNPAGEYSSIAILTVTALDYAYFEDFGDTSGADPADWLDTGARNSLVEDDSLFKTYNVGGEIVFRTISTLKNIHSHYTGAEYNAAAGLILTGRMRMGNAQSGIGVTFLSDYTNADAYYRLRRHSDTAFHLSPHGTAVAGDTDSGVVPAANAWYLYRIEVIDTGSSTEIRANVWPQGSEEPAGWQIDAWDDSAARLTSGRIGVWAMGDGSKYWDDITVAYFDLAP